MKLIANETTRLVDVKSRKTAVLNGSRLLRRFSRDDLQLVVHREVTKLIY